MIIKKFVKGINLIFTILSEASFQSIEKLNTKMYRLHEQYQTHRGLSGIEKHTNYRIRKLHQEPIRLESIGKYMVNIEKKADSIWREHRSDQSAIR